MKNPRSRITRTPQSRILTDDDVKVAIKALRRKCAIMRKAHDFGGTPNVRHRPGGFEGLVRIINGQQVSVASANAIHQRLAETIRPLTAKRVSAASDEVLRGCGLSRPKIKTVRALAATVGTGLDLDGLGALSADEALEKLTAVSGIGPWTAEIYLMFCLGHPDVFAAGDLALQIAAQHAMALPARPSAKEMASIAERWSPHRATAALVLWAYYAEMKRTGSALPI